MRDENDFNAFLSKALRELQPQTYTLKMAEKYHIGIADFQMTRAGRNVTFESKLLRDPLGHRATKLLKHPFTGPQLTYLRGQWRAGAKCFGVIGVDFTKVIHVIPLDELPSDGNWSPHEWANVRSAKYSYDQIHAMADYMFNFCGG